MANSITEITNSRACHDNPQRCFSLMIPPSFCERFPEGVIRWHVRFSFLNPICDLPSPNFYLPSATSHLPPSLQTTHLRTHQLFRFPLSGYRRFAYSSVG